MSDEKLGVDLVEKAVKMLEGKEVTREEILDDTEVPMLISSFFIGRAEREAARRFEKWVEKRGRVVSDSVKARTAFAFGHRTHLDEALRSVFGYYNIAAGLAINHRSLAYRVGKWVRKIDPGLWANRIKGEMQYWGIRFKLDELIMKVVALAAAKTTAWYMRKER